MENPFVTIESRLDRIENLLSDLSERKDPSRPMGVVEAANFLNLAPQTIYGLVCKRAIPHIKQGKKLLFDRAELERWLSKGRREVSNL